MQAKRGFVLQEEIGSVISDKFHRKEKLNSVESLSDDDSASDAEEKGEREEEREQQNIPNLRNGCSRITCLSITTTLFSIAILNIIYGSGGVLDKSLSALGHLKYLFQLTHITLYFAIALILFDMVMRSHQRKPSNFRRILNNLIIIFSITVPLIYWLGMSFPKLMMMGGESMANFPWYDWVNAFAVHGMIQIITIIYFYYQRNSLLKLNSKNSQSPKWKLNLKDIRFYGMLFLTGSVVFAGISYFQEIYLTHQPLYDKLLDWSSISQQSILTNIGFCLLGALVLTLISGCLIWRNRTSTETVGESSNTLAFINEQ